VGAGFDVVEDGVVGLQAVKKETAPSVIVTIKRSIFRFISLDLHRISLDKAVPRYVEDVILCYITL
jgi:hypothetical protein